MNDIAKRPKSPAWDHDLRRPRYSAPPGACDCHFHFIGPQARFPLVPGHVFSHLDFDDDTIDDWVKLQDALGLSRGLHVNSMMYEHSYELMLHSLMRFPDRLRGVVMPAPDITDGELELLTRAGVVGARHADRVSRVLDERIIHRTHEMGWSQHYLVRGIETMEAWRRTILGCPGRFVIEHMGLPPAEKGIDSPEFRFVLECLDTGRCWVKLSPRFSRQETFPFSDVQPFVDEVVKRAPGRALWGSDWPHPQYFKKMPNDADLLDMMLDWAPDEAIRRMILVDNPAELFGFPPVPASHTARRAPDDIAHAGATNSRGGRAR
jgi:predicted TIM-barrel fold metal-dependent hydrolase